MSLELASIVLLTVTNVATLYWATQKRMKASPEVIALHRAIKTFERETSSLLHIEKVDADQVYLRSPRQ